MGFREEHMQDLSKLVSYRKSVGFKTEAYEYSIPLFIEYSSTNHPDAKYITKQMVDEWLEYYPYRTHHTQMVFISTLRQFTCFIHALGKYAYIPDEDYSLKCEKYIPYILDEDELRELFHAIDSYQPYYCYKKFRADIIVPVLFRMMYCCGMRAGEPLRLRTEDIDLNTGEIYIHQSKRSKDRHIVMSNDMLKLCREYEKAIGERQWFFPHPNGGPLSVDWMETQFHICWDRTGLEKRGRLRPYDLRHIFATRTMMSWIDAGKDVMTLIPYLSAYMGHAQFSETLYYIHLLPDRIRKSSGIDWGMFSAVYGEDGDV